jgi:uncharacterized membrane protein
MGSAIPAVGEQEHSVRYEVSAEIDAPPELVWSVLTDVARMPEWNSSMTLVERLDQGPFAVGSSVRIKQPRLPTAVWRVVELTPQRSFSWKTTASGVTTDAGHVLATALSGGTDVTLTLGLNGLLAPLVGLLTSALARRYVDMELEGLKARSEGTYDLRS